jgi:riboflavin kinase / FMN adenylyltransferase
VWVTSSLTTVRTPTIVALGNFDGVHKGHLGVIAPVSELASVVIGSASTVVTFSPHPQEFFTGQRRTLLTPLDEKIRLLQSIGIEQLVLLPFDRELANLSPEQFIETILVQCLQSERVSVGEDFRFGCHRSGNSTDLQTIAATFGIDVEIVPLQTQAGQRISSSAIRQALEQGQLEQANQLLGRPYQLTGQVVQGQQLGRTIGFPTANLKLSPEKFLPRKGVYSVWVDEIDGQLSCDTSSGPILGVMNIGDRPTVNGTQQTIEVHLLDWSGDLYGHTVTVSLEKFLRPEQKFASLDALKDQIQADSEAARGMRAI